MDYIGLRKKMGLSQARLAKLLGVNPVSVKGWESGKVIMSGLNDRKFKLLYRILAQNEFLIMKSNEELRELMNSRVEDPPPLPHRDRNAFESEPAPDSIRGEPR
jgi:transcriptional regulator with XRE-family HTH domain